jgi:hypothetical protein
MCGPGAFADPLGNGCDTDPALELVSASVSWACAKAGFLTGDSSLVNIEFFPSMTLADTSGRGSISTSTACLVAACPTNSPVQFSWILGATPDALAITLKLGPSPPSPTGLTVCVTPGAPSVAVSWNAAAGAAFYKVYQMTPGSTFGVVYVTQATQISFGTNGDVVGSNSFYVTAVNNYVESAPSDTAIADVTNAGSGNTGENSAGSLGLPPNSAIASAGISLLSSIVPNAPDHPSAFSAEVTVSSSTYPWGRCILKLGTF